MVVGVMNYEGILQGGIVTAKVTPANVHDTKPVNQMVHSDMNKLYADKSPVNCWRKATYW
jgi:IS5 family transposase